jgi:hypothetical protein
MRAHAGKAARENIMKTTLRAVAAAIGVLALALQFWLEIHILRGPGLFKSTVHFFSYFTILANGAAAVAMLAPLLAPDGGLARFMEKPSVRTAITGCLIIVGMTYVLFLRHVGDDQSLERIADGVWTIVHGSVSRWYPYPFIDMRSLGYQAGLANMAGFTVVFMIAALALVVFDRTIGSIHSHVRSWGQSEFSATRRQLLTLAA